MKPDKDAIRLQIFCALLSSGNYDNPDEALAVSADMTEFFTQDPDKLDEQIELIEEHLWKLQKSLSAIAKDNAEGAADLVHGMAMVIATLRRTAP